MAEVMLIRWPEDGEEGARLAGAGVAVLYLVDSDGDPPATSTCLEDWVRIPGDERDLSARVNALQQRALAHQAPPRVDEHGRLHYRGRVVSLPPSEARLADALAQRFGLPVPDRELSTAVPADGPSLRHLMAQLRAHVRSVDLFVSRIRRTGYLLKPRT